MRRALSLAFHRRILVPLAVLVMSACSAGRDEGGPGASEISTTEIPAVEVASADGWRSVMTAPLAPRHDAMGAWTGRELVVVGGRTGPPCPPGADCSLAAPNAEAAAYDPETDDWRLLPDAPAAVAGGLAAWSGSEVVVVAAEATLAFDPAATTWRRLDDAPETGLSQLVRTDAGLVAVAYDQGDGGRTVDWRLDTVTGEWERLPRDPWGESYDRSMAFDGEQLWLLSMDVDQHFAATEGAPSRVAVLEEDGWRVVSEDTPPLTYQQWWWPVGDVIVAPPTSWSDAAHVFDPVAGTWTTVDSPAKEHACLLPPAGAGPHWVAGEGAALVAAAGAVLQIPPCPDLPEPDVAVWADDRLLVWGGPAPGYRTNTATGLVWAPPAP